MTTALEFRSNEDREVHAINLRYHRRANERRQRCTEAVCWDIGMAMSDGINQYMRLHMGNGPIRLFGFATYTMVRNHLAYEVEVDYVLACKVAMDITALHVRIYRPQIGYEWGWL